MKKNSKILLSLDYLKILAIPLILLIWSSVSSAAGMVAAHNLQIELVPTENKLIGRDEITIKTSDAADIGFRVSQNMTQIKVVINNEQRDFEIHDGRMQLNLKPDEKTADLRIRIDYSGIFDDPVPVRPANADNPGFGVTGTISPGGTFLLAGAGWYPELINSSATYRVAVKAPAGLIAVTAGRSRGHKTHNGRTVSTWEVDYPVRGLALSAARYVVAEKFVGKVTAATYLLPQNQHLSASYLDATAGYLALYSDLFGAYPFQKFAVVENFFPTGFGFPSYTLMGGTVLRLPFIIHTSLGHEIAHCWWGNGVYVDYADGNWSEGLTSYVADYLYKEMKSAKASLDARRQWVRNYSTLVRPDHDFALSKFQSRYNPLTKTIGYDKAAMIFHMIRRLVGEEAFWGSLRDLCRDRLFQRTSWSDLQHAFEVRGGRSLQKFFDQWVYGKGAPRFAVEVVATERIGKTWRVTAKINQQEPYFSFPLDLELQTRRRTITKKINVAGPETLLEMTCEDPPRKLSADPDSDILRWLYPAEIPPTVNALKSSSAVVTVLSDLKEPALTEAARILALSLGLQHNQIMAEEELTHQQLAGNDILLIGLPRHTNLIKNMPASLNVRTNSFAIDESTYDKGSDVFFGVFDHPVSDKHIAALFMPLSTEYAEIVAAKITHYGKYSYLAFRNGRNQDKGYWPVDTSPLVYLWPGLDG